MVQTPEAVQTPESDSTQTLGLQTSAKNVDDIREVTFHMGQAQKTQSSMTWIAAAVVVGIAMVIYALFGKGRVKRDAQQEDSSSIESTSAASEGAPADPVQSLDAQVAVGIAKKSGSQEGSSVPRNSIEEAKPGDPQNHPPASALRRVDGDSSQLPDLPIMGGKAMGPMERGQFERLDRTQQLKTLGFREEKTSVEDFMKRSNIPPEQARHLFEKFQADSGQPLSSIKSDPTTRVVTTDEMLPRCFALENSTVPLMVGVSAEGKVVGVAPINPTGKAPAEAWDCRFNPFVENGQARPVTIMVVKNRPR